MPKKTTDPTATILRSIQVDLAEWREETKEWRRETKEWRMEMKQTQVELREWRGESVQREDFLKMNELVEVMASDIRQLARTSEEAKEALETRVKRIEDHLHLES